MSAGSSYTFGGAAYTTESSVIRPNIYDMRAVKSGSDINVHMLIHLNVEGAPVALSQIKDHYIRFVMTTREKLGTTPVTTVVAPIGPESAETVALLTPTGSTHGFNASRSGYLTLTGAAATSFSTATGAETTVTYVVVDGKGILRLTPGAADESVGTNMVWLDVNFKVPMPAGHEKFYRIWAQIGSDDIALA